ncbi:hypothetical protein BdWA1_000859 [Babesia duncani]|uniref:Uncharacterized protein n=1 Tax=Babesia duncani TaxID=323732 RepID=A0AAD9PNK6_9APIC|nr:hypothetical protein BdWA1_000859 [Babesia duncani]
MKHDILNENILDYVYNLLVQSIETRIVKENGTVKVNFAKETTLLEKTLGVSLQSDSIDNGTFNYNATLEDRHDVSPCDVKAVVAAATGDSGGELNESSRIPAILDNSIYLYSIAASLYNKGEIGDFCGNDDLDEQCNLLEPPPIPVTPEFRRYNAQASAIFDTFNPENPSFDTLHKDAIYKCLKEPRDFSNIKASLENPSSAINAFGDSAKDGRYYSLVRLLLSWYYSGYFTGRMEAMCNTT